MNTLRLVPATLAALCLATTGAYAKSETKDKDGYKHSQSSTLSEMDIRRVTQDSLDRQTTAKDLIGASVYDSSGEKIGDVADISIAGLTLGKSHSDSDLMGSDNDMESKQSSSQYGQNKDMKDSQNAMSAQWGQRGQATAFISVGGVFGIGDDIVAVPANSLTWDAAEERYTLAASKQQIVALAEQDPIDMEDDNTYSAKQSFDDDTSMIRNAFQSDKNKKDLSGIMVEKEDNRIVLRGTVRSEDAKEHAADLAEQHSDLKIVNSINVSSY
ncbi:BON domain-containing protein [Pelagicoccus sp. SDUM812002]|uniref:PRC-barrel domain-containing protein n=1 Tax=Pelagicoccus sp. SDUM812002 TaxID=3041266 RepID=UPI00280FC48B|nr:BON domain-containing protein [Pelagicoccus sp. SDUM812002]MDQ8186219.1 BON domain-containing protein [Pelagicoccus sp. SDUM812002]